MVSETLLHADIFFFITSIVVIVLGVLGVVALIYFIKILHDVDKFQKKVSTSTGELIEDIKVIKDDIMSEGGGATSIIRLLMRLFGRTARRIKKIKRNL